MIFNIKIADDLVVKKAYEDGMAELNNFWGINWLENTPDIFIVDSRNQVNQIKGKETSDQLVAWAKSRSIFILDFQKLQTESSYKLTVEQYAALIKHELNHLFYGIVSGNVGGPLWLNEGLSIYLSGQTKNGQWEKPLDFRGFIDSEGENRKYAYNEGGFVVGLLVEKFGKEKVIQLVKQLKSMSNEQDFKQGFKDTFGIELNYETINELYLK